MAIMTRFLQTLFFATIVFPFQWRSDDLLKAFISGTKQNDK